MGGGAQSRGAKRFFGAAAVYPLILLLAALTARARRWCDFRCSLLLSFSLLSFLSFALARACSCVVAFILAGFPRSPTHSDILYGVSPSMFLIHSVRPLEIELKSQRTRRCWGALLPRHYGVLGCPARAAGLCSRLLAAMRGDFHEEPRPMPIPSVVSALVRYLDVTRLQAWRREHKV